MNVAQDNFGFQSGIFQLYTIQTSSQSVNMQNSQHQSISMQNHQHRCSYSLLVGSHTLVCTEITCSLSHIAISFLGSDKGDDK